MLELSHRLGDAGGRAARWGNLTLRCCLALAGISISLLIASRPSYARTGAFNFGEVLAVRACPQIYLVAGKNGFAIIRLVGGPQIEDRDVLAGDLERVGLSDVIDVTRNNQQNSVVVEDVLLSRTQYGAHLAHYCNG